MRHRGRVLVDVWLNNDRQLVPGQELFRSDRRFHLYAYTASHGQLMLRSDPRHDDDDPAGPDTTVELLFKPVEAIKIKDGFRRLVVRCGSAEEADRVKASLPGLSWNGLHVFLLESEDRTDYVVSMAVGWREGILPRLQPSLFNPPTAADPVWPVTPLPGVQPGFAVAAVEDLIEALRRGHDVARRGRYRYVFVLMVSVDTFGTPEASPAGVFLSRRDAEEARSLFTSTVSSCWIMEIPVVM